ncbi:HD domain-containing phosphohydrolase [Tistrella sp. BH-R2-4]|uniref:HD domain-containing phosphohydrolase n=1 Tax=Tistrella arctica TaxID=3133430 RepID=A0ABU9YHE3_9PROT
MAGQGGIDEERRPSTVARLLLGASDQDLVDFVELVATPAFVIDAVDNGFVFRASNSLHEQATGMDRATMMGRRMDMPLMADISAQVAPNYQTCITSRQIQTYDECLTMPNGVRWWRTTLIPVPAPDGSIGRIFGSALDITPLHDLEERARRLSADQDALQARLTRTLRTAVDALATAMETRDPYTAGHQHQVSELSVAIAMALGIDQETREMIRLGALLHDVGKLGIPTSLLVKPGRLIDEELALIRAHARIGADMTGDLDLPQTVRLIISSHHERLDGSGYPCGLAGCDIPLPVRIVMVADVIDAMLTDRPYRRHLTLSAVEAELTRNDGRCYDQDIAAVALAVVRGDMPGFTLPDSWMLQRIPRAMA